jgi:hypothetical protein
VLATFVASFRWVLVAGFVLGATAWSSAAHAQAVDNGDGESYAAPAAERRNGFMATLQAEYGYLSVEGYPNKLGQIDNPAYRSHIGGVGSIVSLVIGGALRDWLTAGLVIRSAGVYGEGNIVGGIAGIGLQLQGFPLWERGGAFRDLGLVGEFGVGLGAISDTSDKHDTRVLAEGGSMSHLSLGASYEVFKFGLFSAGPVLNYSHQFSQTMTGHSITGGIKLTFYSAQP